MRRAVTAGLLLTVFTALASACVAGFGSGTAVLCKEGLHRPNECKRHSSVKSTGSDLKTADCSTIISAAPPRCGFRTFTQFSTAQPVAVSFSAPQPQSVKAMRIGDAVIIVSSVGPSETDRGPPRS
ncbi:MAG TPA: hypothetical protein VKH81_16570 [Candidatus Angelobacter sp.]|nr:hypothetical protein [Candidatus Angelobacter sp.]